MTVPQLAVAIVAIAIALSIVMAGAWLVQQRTGNSGWVDTIWTFGLGATGLAAALVPFGGADLSARQYLAAAFIFFWSLRLGLHIAQRTTGITDDPRYADAQAIAHKVMELYTTEEVDRVVVIYNRFESALTQVVTQRELLPLSGDLLERRSTTSGTH